LGGGARRATLALSAGFGFGPLASGLLAEYAPHPTVLPYLAHAIASGAALAAVAGVPAAPRPTTPRGPLLRLGLDRSNRRPFLHGVVWMAPFVFAFPAIGFAALPAFQGGVLAPGYIGALAALTLAAGMVVQPFGRRRAPTATARLGLVTGAVGTALGAGAVSWHASPLLLVTSILLGASYGVLMTSGLRTVQSLAHPETRGGLTGLYYVLTYTGFAAPLGLALAARAMAPATALLGVGALALAAAAVLRPPPR
jgi:hypothetical protein